MAKASRESITIEYCDSIGEFFKHDITESEAESMYYALQEVLGIECVDVPFKECPDTGKTQIYSEDGWRTAYNDKSVPKSHWQTLVDALKSIATSSCCGDCEEAKRVAEVALYEAEVVHSIPVRGTSKVANDWESHYSKLYMAVSQEFHGGLSVMSPYDWDRLRKNFPEPTKV